MRVLVIDADPVDRQRLEAFAGRLGECYATDSGTAALDAFRRSRQASTPFGLVLLDIQLTSMNGTQLLQKLREIEAQQEVPESQRAKIIVVTTHPERETVVTCIRAGCNGLVLKPLSLESVVQKVLELCGPPEPSPEADARAVATSKAQRLVQGVIMRFENGACDLPTLPSVVQEIRNVMNDPASTAKTMASVIEKDPVLSVKVIAVANSPLYRGRDKISSLKTAIPRLGFNGIQSIVHAVANRTMYQTQSAEGQKRMERLWVHSLAVAYGARAIGSIVRFADVERLFLMGLVHDIGKVVLTNEMGKKEIRTEGVGRLRIARAIEEEHTGFGATLLRAWGFGRDFAEMAEEHEEDALTQAASLPVVIVSLANTLAREMGYSERRARKLDLIGLPAAQILKVGEEHFTTLRGQLELTVKKARIAFKL